MSSHDNYNTFERMRFFHGMLLTEQDLQTEQEYHRSKLQIHNRCLHGCRVACGLEVNLRKNFVYIEPGMALDCHGNEIVVSEPAKISLPERKRRFFLTISYTEVEANPVPTFSPGCDSNMGEFSRIRESFKFGWSARDPLSAHDWHNGAWVTCGKPHPVALAKFIVRRKKVRLSRSFKEIINQGRQIW